MSDQNAEQEPTMEEILASIRRIISEDGEEEGSAEAAPEEVPEAEPEPDEEVLELTDEVQDDGTVVNLKTGEEIDEEPAVEAEEEVGLEMIDAEEEPKPEREPEPEDEPEPEAEPEPVAEPALEDAVAAEATERLVSDMPGMESVSTLSGLAAAVDSHRRAVDPSIGPRTIEDLVKEVMRPMIKEWLDDNLPSLVERLVSREIERLTREAEEISQH